MTARFDPLLRKLHLVALLLVAVPLTGLAQVTAFSYQGKLTDGGNPASGNYDMVFTLYDTPTVGTGTSFGVPNPNTRNGVAASAGIFTVTLDFDMAFTGGVAPLYLEIAVRPAGGGAYTTLSPRQQLTASPYAIQTLNAQTLGNVPASRYVATDLTGNVGLGTPPDANMKLKITSGPSQLPIRMVSTGSAGYSAGLEFNTVTNAYGYLGVPDAGATGGSEMQMISGTISFWPGGYRTMTMSSDLNVGIGALPGSSRLFVVDAGTTSAVHGSSANGWGIYGDSSTKSGVYGTSTNNSGVYGYSAGKSGVYGESALAGSFAEAGVWGKGLGSGSIGVNGQADVGNAWGVYGHSVSPTGVGVYAENTGGGRGLAVYGNATQSQSHGGMVKAMVKVDYWGAITRCYNGVTGNTAGTCGFSVSHTVTGNYDVYLGFDASSRFVVVDAYEHVFYRAYVYAYTVNGVTIGTVVDGTDSAANSWFTLLIF